MEGKTIKKVIFGKWKEQTHQAILFEMTDESKFLVQSDVYDEYYGILNYKEITHLTEKELSEIFITY